jgi:hypothetical protein
MPGVLAHLSAARGSTAQLAGLGVALLLAGGIAWWSVRLWKRSRISPEEVERRRRAALNATGKMGDATLLENRGNMIIYSYDVRGVEYTASQDVSGLGALLPTTADAVNGVVYVKYDPRNPANSIILCEQWSGLPSGRAIRA